VLLREIDHVFAVARGQHAPDPLLPKKELKDAQHGGIIFAHQNAVFCRIQTHCDPFLSGGKRRRDLFDLFPDRLACSVIGRPLALFQLDNDILQGFAKTRHMTKSVRAAGAPQLVRKSAKFLTRDPALPDFFPPRKGILHFGDHAAGILLIEVDDFA
jgi:hypothetical protein